MKSAATVKARPAVKPGTGDHNAERTASAGSAVASATHADIRTSRRGRSHTYSSANAASSASTTHRIVRPTGMFHGHTLLAPRAVQTISAATRAWIPPSS